MSEIKNLLDNNCDSYSFLPGEDDDKIHIQSSEYRNKGTKLGGSSVGDCYHIILFRENEDDGGIKDLDKFEGILGAPVEYMASMIKDDWYGIICRKTTTSQEYVEDIFAKLQEV